MNPRYLLFVILVLLANVSLVGAGIGMPPITPSQQWSLGFIMIAPVAIPLVLMLVVTVGFLSSPPKYEDQSKENAEEKTGPHSQ